MFLKRIMHNPDLMLFCITVFVFGFYLINIDFIGIEMYTFGYFFVFCFLFFVFYRSTLLFTSRLNLLVIKPFLAPQILYILGFLFFFLSVLKLLLFLLSNGFHSFMLIRSSVSGAGASLSLGVGISFPLCLASWYVSKLNKSKISIAFLAMSFLLAVISTSKVFLFIFVFYALYFSKVNYFKVLMAILSLFFLFILSHWVLEKFSSNPDDGIFLALWNTFRVYLLGGVAAFQNLISGKAFLNEYIMLTSIKSLLEQFGFYGIPLDPILPWTSIGGWNTNVYTAFGYWYALFEDSFLVFCSFTLAVWYAVVFARAKNSSYEFYKPFLLFCLSFIYMGDQFIPALSMHLVYLFMCLLISATRK